MQKNSVLLVLHNKINSGAHENSKSPIQDTNAYARSLNFGSQMSDSYCCDH